MSCRPTWQDAVNPVLIILIWVASLQALESSPSGRHSPHLRFSAGSHGLASSPLPSNEICHYSEVFSSQPPTTPRRDSPMPLGTLHPLYLTPNLQKTFPYPHSPILAPLLAGIEDHHLPTYHPLIFKLQTRIMNPSLPTYLPPQSSRACWPCIYGEETSRSTAILWPTERSPSLGGISSRTYWTGSYHHHRHLASSAGAVTTKHTSNDVGRRLSRSSNDYGRFGGYIQA